VPAGRPLGPRSRQALPKFVSRLASTPLPPRTPEAPRGDDLPRQRHDSRGTSFPYGRHGHLLLGDMRFGLTPGVTSIISAKGSSTPSTRLYSSDRDPGVPALSVGGASPPGSWLDDP
jgi:hypothetical protein